MLHIDPSSARCAPAAAIQVPPEVDDYLRECGVEIEDPTFLSLYKEHLSKYMGGEKFIEAMQF